MRLFSSQRDGVLVAGCILSGLLSLRSQSAEIKRFEATRVAVSDRFDADSRKDYRIVGDVAWSTLKLTIPKNAAVGRVKTVAADFRLEFDLWPVQLDEGQQCVTKLTYVLTNGYELAVVILRARRQNQILRQVLVAEVRKTAGREPKVEELFRSQMFSLQGDVERWSLTYKNGVTDLKCDNQPVVLTCGQALTAWCNAIFISQPEGTVDLSRFDFRGREAGYTPEQRALYDQTNELRAAAEKAASEGDLRLAVRTEESRIPLVRQAFGPDDVGEGLTYEWVANKAEALNRPDAAKQRYQLAVNNFSKSLGESHPYTLRMKVWVGYQTMKLGDVEGAEAIARPAGIAHLQIAGPKCEASQQVFALLQDIFDKRAKSVLQKGDYAAYQRYCQETADLCQAVHGAEHTTTHLFQNQAAFATQIAEATGKRQEELVTLARDMQRANDLHLNGELSAANQLVRVLVVRCRNLLGRNHPITAETIEFAAQSEMSAGNFGAGLEMLKEVVEIERGLRGADDPIYAFSEGQLAGAYSAMERYDEATPLFEHAIKVLADKNLKSFAIYLQTEVEYGRHLMRMNRMAEAEHYLRHCLQTYLDSEAGFDATAMKACERLTNLYWGAGNISAAEQMLELQKAMLQRYSGNMERAQLDIMLQEANRLHIKGDLDGAIERWRETQVQIAEMYGKRSRAYETVLEGLLESLAVKQDKEGVAAVFGEILEFTRLRRESLFAVYTAREQFERSASDRVALNRLMSLVMQGYIKHDDAYEHLLGIKGAVTLHQRRTQLAASNPKLGELFERRQRVNADMASMLARPLSRADAEKVSQLVSERDAVDAEMLRKSAEYRVPSEKLTLQRILDVLPEGCALVDYVEYERPPNWLERLAAMPPQPQLGVFVVIKPAGVKFVPLGPAASVGHALIDWRLAIAEEAQNLVVQFDADRVEQTDRRGAAVRSLVWDPIEKELIGTKNVILSPDGPLMACPFPAFPLGDNERYLVEEYSLSHVAAPCLLPDLMQARNETRNSKLLLVGDVDYDVAASAGADASAEPARKPAALQFAKLPEPEQELAPIRQHFQRSFPGSEVLELVKEAATEVKVRQSMADADYIHFQTHGFCVPLSVLYGVSEEDADSNHAAFDPMIAGIAFAGANRVENNSNGLEDGILWASEMAILNLSDADLVVLSACQTAVGDMFPGEGIQGGQRAVVVAGARSSLTSMWIVSDLATKELMARFYDNLWVRKQSRAAALQDAMIYMLREYQWSEKFGASSGAHHRCPPWLWSCWVLDGSGF